MSRYCLLYSLILIHCPKYRGVGHFLILFLSFSGFTHVTCDYSSIVASAEGKNGKDVLKAYSFTS